MKFDLPALRHCFPMLASCGSGKPLRYLDSAATTLKPSTVIEAEREYATSYTANIHRGHHRLSEIASEKYETAREVMGRFVGTAPRNIIFTKNATESINMVANGFGFTRSDVVALPIGEHHSNILPWMRLCELAWIEHEVCAPVDGRTLEEVIATNRPRMFVFSSGSNVTGAVNDIRTLCAIAARHGISTCVDASQTASHEPIEFDQLGCDFLAFSGHKMFGPPGTGVLAGRPEALERLTPYVIGGGSVASVTRDGFVLRDVPYRFEAGTPNISGVIGLAAAAQFLSAMPIEERRAHLVTLSNQMSERGVRIPGARSLMSDQPDRLPLVSFAFSTPHITSDTVATSLSENHNIMVRSGSMCAHPLVHRAGADGGLLRVSAHLYNSLDDIDETCNAIEEFTTRFS